jgi:hypothetical protein
LRPRTLFAHEPAARDWHSQTEGGDSEQLGELCRVYRANGHIRIQEENVLELGTTRA